MTESIRISYDVRRAPRAHLIAELEDFATHREAQGKTERAAGARAAAKQLADGAERVRFEHSELVVDETPDRSAVRRGNREWVLAELRESVEGWTHHGNRSLAIEADRAAQEVESGATRVRAGHIEYEVVDDG